MRRQRRPGEQPPAAPPIEPLEQRARPGPGPLARGREAAAAAQAAPRARTRPRRRRPSRPRSASSDRSRASRAGPVGAETPLGLADELGAAGCRPSSSWNSSASASDMRRKRFDSRSRSTHRLRPLGRPRGASARSPIAPSGWCRTSWPAPRRTRRHGVRHDDRPPRLVVAAPPLDEQLLVAHADPRAVAQRARRRPDGARRATSRRSSPASSSTTPPSPSASTEMRACRRETAGSSSCTVLPGARPMIDSPSSGTRVRSGKHELEHLHQDS